MTELNFDTETVTPDLVCVECGKPMDRTAGACAPGPGDFTLCIGCASLNIFNDDMRFRKPTDEEMLAAAADAEFQTARRAILKVNASRDASKASTNRENTWLKSTS